jgi:preprotein translocase subunit SecD
MRIVFIFAAIILSVYLLYPTVKLSLMSDTEEQELATQNPDELIDLKSKAVTLGLDLQGGMHVVLEVDVRELMNKLAKNKNPEFVAALKEATDIVTRTDEDFITIFQEELAKRDMLLERYYGSAERRTEADVIAYLRTQTDEAVDRSLEILRNRIDQFGVTEPTIQKQGGRRIILELAGVTDPGRVRKIVGQTALLEFKLLKDDVTTNQVADKINKFIMSRISPEDTTLTEEGEADTTTSTALEELFGVEDQPEGALADTTTDSTAVAKAKDSIFEEGLFFQSPYDKNTILVPADKEEKFRKIIELPEIKNHNRYQSTGGQP